MMSRAVSCLLVALWGVVPPAAARAQDPPGETTEKKTEERPTGLPARIKWTFNFDAGWGTFGFANSLYDNPKNPGVNENLSDQWFEGYVKPALSGEYTLKSSSQVYGKLSAVGERTYGSVPTEFGEDVSSFQAEDLYVGWRSGESLGVGENAVDLTVGRAQYTLGHGFLLYDGSSEGGSRGGYWTNARKAFQFAAIARFKPGHHAIEAFYLDRDELPEDDLGSRLWGINYEFSPERSTIGATYMRWAAHHDLSPGRDGLNVFNLRAYTAPVPAAPDLTFELEYAAERNGEARDSNAWTAQGAYELSRMKWAPTFTYRYAFFEGDDPRTPADESFDPLSPGFYDWGSWWQGEIAGEYFLSNSNLITHLIRAHLTPNEKVSGGLLFYKFRLDHPETYGPHVTDKNVAFETDLYVDWKVNSNFAVSFLGAYSNPQEAVRQATGRTKNFAYGMVYVGYSF
ncbi:MAG TPA: alginate export family protein [Vicinamibacterales bacterium]|nr:alginate export family protein [Vicinamibacterales bacterium]